MKQRLLKTLAIGLLAMVGVNAWADNTVRYSTDGGTNWTEAADLNALIGTGCAITAATTDLKVELSDNQKLDKQIKWDKTYTLTITASKAVEISRNSLSRTTAWFINTTTGTVNIGDASQAITFKGAGHKDDQRIFKELLGNESTGRMNVTNCTFKDFKFANENSNDGYLWRNKSANGITVFKDITVDNCVTTKEAFIQNRSSNNDNIYLQGTIDFKSNCVGTHFHTLGRLRLGEVNGNSSVNITVPNTITIYWANATKTPQTNVVVKALSGMASKFELTNEDRCIYGNNTDLKMAEAYTLTVKEANAATLVIPFATTIPDDATCYTLDYSSGANIDASLVETTLPANTPVLVTATGSSEGKKYKFNASTAPASTTTASTDVEVANRTSGVLVGNYTDSWTVLQTTGDNTNYILQNQSGNVGFYKIGESGHSLNANRAYMSVKRNVGGSSPAAPAFFSLDFNGMNGTTGISITSREETTRNNDGAVYNLNGVRMNSENLPKGIYVKNGRKFIVK